MSSGPRSIDELAASLGLAASEWRPYGRDIAKIDPGLLRTPRRREGAPRLVLVSAITPTPAGEGKTTTSIGLAQIDVSVRAIQIQAGAGFLVALTGEILRMPGLPRRPLAESIDLVGGAIVGVH